MTATAADLANLPFWPRLLSREQAAAYCSLSPTAFDDHIRPHLNEIRPGGARSVRFDRTQLDRHLDVISQTGAGFADRDEAADKL